MRRAAGGDEGERIIYGKPFEYWFSLFQTTHVREITLRGEFFKVVYNRYSASWREVHVLDKIASEIHRISLNVK